MEQILNNLIKKNSTVARNKIKVINNSTGMNSLIGLKPFDCKHWFEQWIDLIYKRHIDSGVGNNACKATYY